MKLSASRTRCVFVTAHDSSWGFVCCTTVDHALFKCALAAVHVCPTIAVHHCCWPSQSTYWLTFELMWRDYFRFYSAKQGDALFHKDGVQPRANHKWKVRNSFYVS
jgi:hypothetical protein